MEEFPCHTETLEATSYSVNVSLFDWHVGNHVCIHHEPSLFWEMNRPMMHDFLLSNILPSVKIPGSTFSRHCIANKMSGNKHKFENCKNDCVYISKNLHIDGKNSAYLMQIIWRMLWVIVCPFFRSSVVINNHNLWMLITAEWLFTSLFVKGASILKN